VPEQQKRSFAGDKARFKAELRAENGENRLAGQDFSAGRHTSQVVGS
jgi:hypothetical protein